MPMWNERPTASVRGLEEFEFTRTEVLTWGSGIIVTHHWLHKPTGVDGTGYPTKREAVRVAREYRAMLKIEQAQTNYMAGDRSPYDMCERGITGCCVDHTAAPAEQRCLPW